MSIKSKEVLSLGRVLQKQITVPVYQRPYKWSRKQAVQLLDDILQHQNKDAYRIGTVVFHEYSKGKKIILDVVDGQQRLVTLSLLLLHLAQDAGIKGLTEIPLLDLEFDHSVSRPNIRKNYAALTKKMSAMKEDERFLMYDFVLNKCQVVFITIDDISEAFQFFDSQNARGKDLEPYDLLKAFHLREMTDVTEKEVGAYVTKWEEAVKSGKLKHLIDNYLFRIRRWTQGRSGYEFTKDAIDVFKGVSLNKVDKFNYLKSYRVNDHFTREYDCDPIRSIDNQKSRYPFQIDQVMLNGKYFFEYVEHYLTEYLKLFSGRCRCNEDIISLLDRYEGRHRTGDKYIRNLFECAMLHYYDKFGDHNLEQITEVCFVWSYEKRLLQNAVKLATMDNEGRRENSIFKVIRDAVFPSDVLNMRLNPVDKEAVEGTKVDEILSHFQTLGY
jgi:hypothetical protein